MEFKLEIYWDTETQTCEADIRVWLEDNSYQHKVINDKTKKGLLKKVYEYVEKCSEVMDD